MVMLGEIKSCDGLKYYLPLRFGHWVKQDEPDSWGEYQVRCSLCGAYDVHSIYATSKVMFCHKCAACMDDEIPETALSEREVYSEMSGGINRDEEESE